MTAATPPKVVAIKPEFVDSPASRSDTLPTDSDKRWAQIEGEFRSGLRSNRAIAAGHGITEGALRKRAKRDGWTQDLGPRIAAKAEQLVRTELATVRSEGESVRTKGKLLEHQIVNSTATAMAGIKLRHRSDIRGATELVTTLMAALRLEVGNLDALRELGMAMWNPDKSGRDALNDLYMKIVSLPGLSKTAKDLADSLGKLVELEMRVWGMDAAQERENRESGRTSLPVEFVDPPRAAE